MARVVARKAFAMNRRRLLQIAAALPLLGGLWRWAFAPAEAASSPSRIRPGDPAWPLLGEWQQLSKDVGGRLFKVRSPLAVCIEAPSGAACAEIFKELKNPYYLGDEVGLTQSLGWVGAWTSRPSVYAVAAETTADVVAAVNFAREHNLRLVVKGGGHSYFGGSNAADLLLIWTRKMNAVAVHDAFVGAGCAGRVEPAPAVTVGSGRDLAAGLWRSHDQDGPLCPRRRLLDGRCRRPDLGRRLRQFFQALWHGCCEPVGGGDRDRGRRRQDRQSVHEPRSLLGDQGRRRRVRRRHSDDLANP